MSFSLMCHNIDIDACNDTPPPPGATVDMQTIWLETTEPYLDLSIYRFGWLGAEGNRLIANVGSRIITSEDLGETWLEGPSLPAGASAGNYLVPTHWQWVDSLGLWFTQLRDNNATTGNQSSYVASTDGVSWTIGPALTQTDGDGRYSSRSVQIVDGVGSVTAGRGSSNIYYNKYDNSLYAAGDSTIRTSTGDGNHYAVLPLTGGYFAWRVTSGGNQSCKFLSDDMVLGPNKVPSGSATTASGRGLCVTNGDGVVLIPRGLPGNYDRFTPTEVTPLPNFSLPAATLDPPELRFGSKGGGWLAARSEGGVATWTLNHDADPLAVNFGENRFLQLPTDQSSQGTEATLTSIVAAADDWWVGFYVDQGTNDVRFIKFQYAIGVECQ